MAEGKIHRESSEVSMQQLFEDFKKDLGDEVGAVGSFIGVVRGEAKEGGKVRELQYECMESAEEELKKLASEIEKEYEGLSEVSVHHIIDNLEPGDEIVYVFAAGSHREEVFEALPEIMDRLKAEVHIWKKEVTDEDDYWVREERDR